MEVNEPAVAYEKRKYSIEEYLERENAATEKHEYYKGEIFAMSGAKMPHNKIAKNLLVSLAIKLKGKPCEPFGSDVRIHVEKNTLFTYADISIICGEPESLNNDGLNFLNPSVIFEVLSASTRKYDKEEKFKLYQDIPTLTSYILVEPELVKIEAWHIDNNGSWKLKEYNNIEEVLDLPSIQASLDLKEIYAGAVLPGA